VEVVELSYLPANRAPEVTLSSPKGGEIWSGKKTVRWSGRDPDGDRLRYEVLWSADRGQNWTKIEAEVKPEGAEKEEKKPVGEGAEKAVPEGGGKTQQEPKPAAPAPRPPTPGKERRAAVGSPLADMGLEAGGEDGEEPPAEAEAGQETKPEAETKEAPAGAPTGRATSIEWDTAKAADGAYLIKVTVTDAISNPGEARQGESVSRLLLVDNSAPELIVDRARKEGDAPPAELAAFERTTYITSAEFRVDEGEWLAALAKDGMFDGQLEYVVLDEGRLPQGAHQVEVRVRDAAGNTASATLRYTR
jgi:hypothetical protein